MTTGLPSSPTCQPGAGERGYSGMNLTALTSHVQIRLWQFILLGLLFPVTSAVLSLLLIHRLERRFGVRGRGPARP